MRLHGIAIEQGPAARCGPRLAALTAATCVRHRSKPQKKPKASTNPPTRRTGSSLCRNWAENSSCFSIGLPPNSVTVKQQGWHLWVWCGHDKAFGAPGRRAVLTVFQAHACLLFKSMTIHISHLQGSRQVSACLPNCKAHSFLLPQCVHIQHLPHCCLPRPAGAALWAPPNLHSVPAQPLRC